MANTPNIYADQNDVLVGMRLATLSMRVDQLQGLSAINFPTPGMRSSEMRGLVTIDTSSNLRAASAQILVVARGKIDNPKLKSWTYTMDGHDFYVLKLGTYFKTLVYDLTTQNWSWWTSNPASDTKQPDWRASTGMNWLSAGSIPYDYGSDVIVGDESSPVLWVLDPEYPYDDPIEDGSASLPFERVATGQVTSQGRNFIPCFEIDLSFSSNLRAVNSDYVVLKYSDDLGQTYVTADAPVMPPAGDFYQELQWRSMGQIKSPGRLFQILDDGALPRIDSLNINPETGQ